MAPEVASALRTGVPVHSPHRWYTHAEERPGLLVAVPRSRIAYVWLFSLARGECGEGKRVSMWRKTGPEESGTLKNTDWGHLKNPWHLKEPESHR